MLNDTNHDCAMAYPPKHPEARKLEKREFEPNHFKFAPVNRAEPVAKWKDIKPTGPGTPSGVNHGNLRHSKRAPPLDSGGSLNQGPHSLSLSQPPTVATPHSTPSPSHRAGRGGGLNALQWAAEHDLAPLAELAISSGDRVDEAFEGSVFCYSPLHMAAYYDSPDVIRTLIRHGASVDDKGVGSLSPLFIATLFDSARSVGALLQLGAAVPLVCAHQGVGMPAHYSASRGSVECMRAFVDGGFDFNVRGPGGLTVLHLASDPLGVEMLEYLLEQEEGMAIIDARDSHGRTPLHYAVCCRHKEKEKARALLDCGADTRLEDHDGYTPAELAYKRGMVDLHGMLLESARSAPHRECVGALSIVGG